MDISATQVKELREKTGAGMMDCKKALTETNGDLENAVDFLRKKGLLAAAKKAGRTAADGLIVCIADGTGSSAVVLEVNCETDFVARNEGFQRFVNDVALHILAEKPATLDDLINHKTITHLLTEIISKIGENIVIRRFERFELKREDREKGAIASYVHGGGKIGVLVEVDMDPLNQSIQTFSKDIAMHVAAANPQVIKTDDVSKDLIAKEKDIYLEQLKLDPKNANKPPQIIEKILEGKIKKFVDEVSLLNQAFVKNTDLTVNQLLTEIKTKTGGLLTIKRFVRFQLGDDGSNRKPKI